MGGCRAEVKGDGGTGGRGEGGGEMNGSRRLVLDVLVKGRE